MRVVSLEGPIAIGKTTILNDLEKRGYTIFPEPIEEWKPLLDRHYGFPPTAKSSMELQREIAFSIVRRWKKIQAHRGPSTLQPVIMERSLMAGRYVFSEVLKKLYPDPKWKKIDEMYNDFINTYETNVFRIGLYSDFTMTILRSRERGSPTTEGSSDYQKLIFDENNNFLRRCHATIKITHDLSPYECGGLVYQIIKDL